MNFQNPGAFWWMLPLGGFIVALYLLRMRRKDTIVPATFLWPERVDEVRANSLFQRLRFNWLLVLQLIALSFLVLGLTRWQTQQRGLTGKVTVAVVDTSASMGATDLKPNRFSAAMDSVKGMIASLQAGDQLAVIEAGVVPRVVFSLSNDSAKMRRDLESIELTDAESDVGEALRLAAGLAAQTPGAKIVLISDGCFERVEDFSVGKAELVFAKVGESSKNLAIQSLGTSQGASGMLAYVGVKNFGLSTGSGTLTLLSEGKPFYSTSLAIAETKTWGRTVTVPPGAKMIEARLVPKDDCLAADNSLWSPVGKGSALRVLLVSAGNVFLERALSLDPRVTLDRAVSVPVSEEAGTAGASQFDLVVFDGTRPVPVKAPGVLSFGLPPAQMSVSGEGTASGLNFLESANDPLVEGVDFGEVYVDKARRAQPAGSTRSLVDSNKGPLVLASDGKQQQIYVTFGLFDSDFPLSFSFPIFISNVLDRLGSGASQPELVATTGQTIGLAATGNWPIEISGPSQMRASVPPVNGRYLLRLFDKVGRYDLSNGQEKQSVFVNLRSDRESDVRPEDLLKVGGGQVAAQAELVRFADLWRPLALLALLVLAGEWFFYARRS